MKLSFLKTTLLSGFMALLAFTLWNQGQTPSIDADKTLASATIAISPAEVASSAAYPLYSVQVRSSTTPIAEATSTTTTTTETASSTSAAMSPELDDDLEDDLTENPCLERPTETRKIQCLLRDLKSESPHFSSYDHLSDIYANLGSDARSRALKQHIGTKLGSDSLAAFNEKTYLKNDFNRIKQTVLTLQNPQVLSFAQSNSYAASLYENARNNLLSSINQLQLRGEFFMSQNCGSRSSSACNSMQSLITTQAYYLGPLATSLGATASGQNQSESMLLALQGSSTPSVPAITTVASPAGPVGPNNNQQQPNNQQSTLTDTANGAFNSYIGYQRQVSQQASITNRPSGPSSVASASNTVLQAPPQQGFLSSSPTSTFASDFFTHN